MKFVSAGLKESVIVRPPVKQISRLDEYWRELASKELFAPRGSASGKVGETSSVVTSLKDVFMMGQSITDMDMFL